MSSDTQTPPQPLSGYAAEGGTEAERFLTSDWLNPLVGPRKDTYVAKWRRHLIKSNGDFNKAKFTLGWNWAAFFLTFPFLLYRRMWGPAFLVFIALAINVLSPSIDEKTGRGIGLVIGVVCAIFADGFYLKDTYLRWKTVTAVKDSNLASGMAFRQGGVSWLGAIGGLVAVLGLIGVALIGEDFNGNLLSAFGQTANCSSDDTKDTVYKLARQKLVQNGMVALGVDADKTTFDIKFIRTTGNTNKKYECAGSLVYNVKLSSTANPPNGVEQVAANLAALLNTDIRYTVEPTDDGENIWVRVNGLKQ